MRPLPVYNITPLETLRHFGVLKAFGKVVLRILRVRPVVIVALDLTPLEPPTTSGDDIREATPDDSERFDAAGFTGLLPKKLPLGPAWISLGEAGMRAWYHLARRDSAIADWLVVRTDSQTTIWSGGIWVHRDLRGHDMASRIRAPALRWSQQQGYRELAAWIDRTNHSSLHSSHKAGYRAIGQVLAFKRFGFAVVRHGRRWSAGRWTADHPLVISLEDLREDYGPAVSLETVIA